MPITKRHMNWRLVGFTPAGGSLLSATGVTQVQYDTGGSLVKFSGDGDRYPTTVVNDFADPTFTVTTADQVWVNSLGIGTRGVFTATHSDAKLAAIGSIQYTMAGAIVADAPVGGQHRQFGQGTATFNAESADGLTNPVSSTLVN